MKKIVFATNNEGKIKELRKIFDECFDKNSFEIYSLKDIGVKLDVDEDGLCYEHNAMLKARYVYDKVKDYIVIADDSGLEIEALDNEPGLLSARYMGETTDYEIKNNNLIERLNATNSDNRSARFVCVLAVIFDNFTERIVRAEWEGEISDKISGENGFGYDPIFYLREYDMTSAQLSEDLKNKISHRAKALKKLSLLKEFKDNR